MHRGTPSVRRWTGVAAVVLCLTATTTPAEPTNAPASAASSPVTLAPSPVKVFRELLLKPPEEREELLSLRPPGMREPLEAKIKEYLALSPEERELRLQATELRHYLLQLMPVPATNRPPLLAQIPEPMRAVVTSRLETWNLFPPAMQDEMIENEQMVRYFTQLRGADATQREAILAGLSPAQQARVKSELARWQSLSDKDRSAIFTQLNQFFDLNPSERETALRKLSEPEREAMEQTLTAFGHLTPQQRAVCIASFAKFANMTLPERQLFLKQADAWQRMTPSERERWRELVTRVPDWPPLPPGMLPLPAAAQLHPVPAAGGSTNR